MSMHWKWTSIYTLGNELVKIHVKYRKHTTYGSRWQMRMWCMCSALLPLLKLCSIKMSLSIFPDSDELMLIFLPCIVFGATSHRPHKRCNNVKTNEIAYHTTNVHACSISPLRMMWLRVVCRWNNRIKQTNRRIDEPTKPIEEMPMWNIKVGTMMHDSQLHAWLVVVAARLVIHNNCDFIVFH